MVCPLGGKPARKACSVTARRVICSLHAFAPVLHLPMRALIRHMLPPRELFASLAENATKVRDDQGEREGGREGERKGKRGREGGRGDERE